MKISLVRLTTKELAALTQRIIEASKKGNYQLSGSKELLNVLEQQYQEYDNVFTKNSFSGKGKEVAEADKKRDEAYVCFRDFLKSYSKMTLLPNYQNAATLYDVLKSLGLDLANYNYAEQTAQMNKLIEVLNTETHKTLIESLNLTTTFEDLKTKQKAFDTLYLEQAEANASLRQMPSATTIRRNVEKALRDYINYLTIFKNSEEYKNLYADINELIKGIK